MALAGQTPTQRRQRMQWLGRWATERRPPWSHEKTFAGQTLRQRPQPMQLAWSTATRTAVEAAAEPDVEAGGGSAVGSELEPAAGVAVVAGVGLAAG